MLVCSLLGYFEAERHGPIAAGAIHWHLVDDVWLAVFASLNLASSRLSEDECEGWRRNNHYRMQLGSGDKNDAKLVISDDYYRLSVALSTAEILKAVCPTTTAE